MLENVDSARQPVIGLSSQADVHSLQALLDQLSRSRVPTETLSSLMGCNTTIEECEALLGAIFKVKQVDFDQTIRYGHDTLSVNCFVFSVLQRYLELKGVSLQQEGDELQIQGISFELLVQLCDAAHGLLPAKMSHNLRLAERSAELELTVFLTQCDEVLARILVAEPRVCSSGGSAVRLFGLPLAQTLQVLDQRKINVNGADITVATRGEPLPVVPILGDQEWRGLVSNLEVALQEKDCDELYKLIGLLNQVSSPYLHFKYKKGELRVTAMDSPYADERLCHVLEALSPHIAEVTLDRWTYSSQEDSGVWARMRSALGRSQKVRSTRNTECPPSSVGLATAALRRIPPVHNGNLLTSIACAVGLLAVGLFGYSTYRYSYLEENPPELNTTPVWTVLESMGCAAIGWAVVGHKIASSVDWQALRQTWANVQRMRAREALIWADCKLASMWRFSVAISRAAFHAVVPVKSCDDYPAAIRRFTQPNRLKSTQRTSLASSLSPNLKSLNIQELSHELTNEILEDIVAQCPHLQELVLKGPCPQVDAHGWAVLVRLIDLRRIDVRLVPNQDIQKGPLADLNISHLRPHWPRFERVRIRIEGNDGVSPEELAFLQNCPTGYEVVASGSAIHARQILGNCPSLTRLKGTLWNVDLLGSGGDHLRELRIMATPQQLAAVAGRQKKVQVLHVYADADNPDYEVALMPLYAAAMHGIVKECRELKEVVLDRGIGFEPLFNAPSLETLTVLGAGHLKDEDIEHWLAARRDAGHPPVKWMWFRECRQISVAMQKRLQRDRLAVAEQELASRSAVISDFGDPESRETTDAAIRHLKDIVDGIPEVSNLVPQHIEQLISNFQVESATAWSSHDIRVLGPVLSGIHVLFRRMLTAVMVKRELQNDVLPQVVNLRHLIRKVVPEKGLLGSSLQWSGLDIPLKEVLEVSGECEELLKEAFEPIYAREIEVRVSGLLTDWNPVELEAPEVEQERQQKLELALKACIERITAYCKERGYTSKEEAVRFALRIADHITAKIALRAVQDIEQALAD